LGKELRVKNIFIPLGMFININRNAVLQIKQMEIVLDREMGSCLDPKLSGTGLQEGGKRARSALSW
jgi:hypothetical protein